MIKSGQAVEVIVALIWDDIWESAGGKGGGAENPKNSSRRAECFYAGIEHRIELIHTDERYRSSCSCPSYEWIQGEHKYSTDHS